jgi:hypothetical protein
MPWIRRTVDVPAGPGIGLPQAYVRQAWEVVILIVLVGCLVSIRTREWMWLARSGALITVVAMVAAQFNTDVVARLLIQYLNDYRDPAAMVRADVRAKPYLYGIGRSLAAAEEREVIEREVRRFNEDKQTILKNEMKSALGRLELAIAASGTLLWGFADLLDRLY